MYCRSMQATVIPLTVCRPELPARVRCPRCERGLLPLAASTCRSFDVTDRGVIGATPLPYNALRRGILSGMGVTGSQHEPNRLSRYRGCAARLSALCQPAFCRRKGGL